MLPLTMLDDNYFFNYLFNKLRWIVQKVNLDLKCNENPYFVYALYQYQSIAVYTKKYKEENVKVCFVLNDELHMEKEAYKYKNNTFTFYYLAKNFLYDVSEIEDILKYEFFLQMNNRYKKKISTIYCRD